MTSQFGILIVDDSNSLRNLIRKSLESAGYDNLLEAIDGKDALDMLMEHKVSLIICGLYMSKVNGLELVKALKNHSTLKVIPFIILTSDTEDETFKEVMKIGATDFIKKPFTKEDLVVKIKSIIEWL